LEFLHKDKLAFISVFFYNVAIFKDCSTLGVDLQIVTEFLKKIKYQYSKAYAKNNPFFSTKKIISIKPSLHHASATNSTGSDTQNL
jgi:hypothetical protein